MVEITCTQVSPLPSDLSFRQAAFPESGHSILGKITKMTGRFRPLPDVEVPLIRIVFANTTSYDELFNVISRLAEFSSLRILFVRSNIPRNWSIRSVVITDFWMRIFRNSLVASTLRMLASSIGGGTNIRAIYHRKSRLCCGRSNTGRWLPATTSNRRGQHS